MRVGFVLTWLLLVLLSAKASASSFTTSEEISNIVAGPNQTLLVTTGSSLLRLSGSLEEIEVDSFDNKVASVGVRWSGENPTSHVITVVCLTNQSYFVYNSTQESSLLSNLVKTNVLPGPSSPNAIALHLNGDSFYTGKFGYVQLYQKNISYLGQFQYSSSSSNTLRAGNYLTVNDFDRLYKSSFSFGGFIYFVAEDYQNGMPYFTITRLCEQSNANEECFQALYEAQLSGIPTNKTSHLVNVQFTDGFESIDVPMVIVSISSNQNSGLYAFKLTDIDKKMKDRYNKCKMQHHYTDTIGVPWMEMQQNCMDFGVQSHVQLCDFNSFATNVEVLYSDSAGTTHPIIELESSMIASTLVRQSGKLFLYTAHANGTNSYITKFLVTVSVSGHGPAKSVQFSTEPVHQFQKSHIVKQLVWSKQNNDTLYYTTTNEVHKLPVDECPEHSSCFQCVSSANSLCGWCVLEGVCSTLDNCQNGSLDLRWATDKNSCPDINVISNVVSSDNFDKVSLNVTKGLPDLVDEEMYSCLLTNQQHNISLSVPLKNNTCQIQSVFSSIQFLDLQVSVTGPLSSEHVVTVVGTVTIVVCSQAKSCTSCLELSTVCGWCNLDTKCSGSATLCSHEWLTLENTTSLATQVCPIVLLPAKGIYSILTGKVTQLVLNTSNTPMENFEHNYQCELKRHGNASLVTVAEATNQGSNAVICHFNQSQTGELATSTESATLRLLLSSNHTKYTMEVLNSTSENISTVIPVRMYNCSAVAPDCSTCITTSHALDLNCGWCAALNICSPRNGACPSPIATDTNTCPLPVLHSISPNSGSILGGTVVTIHGEDLGVRYSDIVGISIGEKSCTPLNHTYIFGTQIQCKTGSSSESGSMSVVVAVQRGESVILTNESESVTFLYLEPIISSVYPLWGPVAGGSHLMIRGTHFDIGNSSGTRVLLGKTACKLTSLQADRIDCITTNSTVTGEASVKVIIDGAVIQKAGVVFEYRLNPRAMELYPNRTIPAGGITLYFIGQHMDSVTRPTLQLVHSNHIYSSECQTANSTHLSCKAPQLSIEAASVMTSSPLDYTLLLDGAPRPEPANISLSLNPNPHFSHIYYSDRNRAYVDENPIRIAGDHIDSVLASEIQVKIGDHPCHIVLLNSMVLACIPPNVSQQVTEFSAAVVVDVANNSLTFSVGTVSYLRKQQPVLSTAVTIIIVVAVLVFSLVTLILAVVCVRCWTRKHPPLRNLKKHTELKRKDSTFSKSLERSMDPNNDYCDLMGDNPNIYESIDAVVYQNNPIKQHILASKHLMDRRPASDNLNLAPTYQNPHIGLHDGPFSSSSSPNIVGLGSSSTHTSHTQISSLAGEDDIDGTSTPTLAKVEFGSIALRRPKKQDHCKEKEDGATSLETNEDYVQMRISNTSLHPWERKSLGNEDHCNDQSEVEDHYVVMRSASESSVKSPNEQQPAEVFEYPSTNPLYDCSQTKGELPTTDDVFYSSCGDYVAMKRIN